MNDAGGQEAVPRGRWALDVLGLVVLAGWLAGVGLGEAALVDPDEPRSALVARLMVERGDWLAPHLPAVFHHDYPGDPLEGNLLAYWDKPPLFFWLEALAMAVLGPTALAARLPAALAQVATVLLVYACGRFLGGRRAGLLAGVVAATAPQLLVMGHVARMETLLVALMTAMLLAVLRLVHDRPRSWGWMLVLYVSAGLAVLTKGPVAVVLPAVAVGATCLASGRWGDLGRLRPLAGAAIVLLIAAPWYVYMHLRYPPGQGGGPGFAYAYFVGQHVLRATTEVFGHYEHVPGYLVGILMLGFLPWSVFLPGACAQVGRAGWRERRDRPAVVLVLAWAVAVVVAFSLSTTQLEHYVLPAVPAVAVVTGAYLADRTRPEDRSRLFRVGLWMTLVSGAGAIVAMVAVLALEGLWRTAYLVPVVAIAAISVAGLVQLVRGRRLAAVGLTVAWVVVVATFAFVGDPFDVCESRSARAAARVLDQSAAPADRVLAFPYTSYSLAWYLWPREVPYLTEPGAVDAEPSLEALVRELNRPERTYVVLYKRKAVDYLREKVRWPVTVLAREPRVAVIVTEPPGAEVTDEP